MRLEKLSQHCETAILILLGFTILWKGGKTLESVWLLTGVAGVCTLAQYFGSKQRSVASGQKITWIVLLFIAATAVSYVLSKTKNYGLDDVLRDGSLGLLLLWYLKRPETVATATKKTFEEQFFQVLSAIAISSCIVGLFIYVLQPVNRFVGTFADPRFHTDYWPNAAAQFLLLTWPIVLLREKKSRFSLLPTGFVLGCLFLTFSRGGIIAFLGQIILLTILLFLRQGTEHKLRIHLFRLAGSLLIGVCVFFSMNALRSPFYPVESVQKKVTFTAAEGSSSASERASFWKQALILTAKKPIFGWGPGSFRFVQPHLQERVLATSDHPHNIFLKLSAERGVIVATLFLLLLFFIFQNGLHHVLRGKRLESSPDSLRIGFPLVFTALAGVIAHNLIDFNLQFVGIALPFWIMLGMLSAQAKKATEKVKYKKFLLAAPALVAVLLLLIAFREGMYLITSSMGRHAEAQGDGEKALEWYELSRGEWFTRDLEFSSANLYLESGKFEEAESALNRYYEKNGEDARGWKLLGILLATLESWPEAIEVYETAFAYGGWNDLSISHGLLQVLLAETYMQPTSDAAADSKRLPLHPDLAVYIPEIEKRVRAFVEAIEQNLHFVALSPNPEEAIRILITLSVLSPQKAPEYRAMIDSIERETLEERDRWKARLPGWLW